MYINLPPPLLLQLPLLLPYWNQWCYYWRLLDSSKQKPFRSDQSAKEYCEVDCNACKFFCFTRLTHMPLFQTIYAQGCIFDEFVSWLWLGHNVLLESCFRSDAKFPFLLSAFSVQTQNSEMNYDWSPWRIVNTQIFYRCYTFSYSIVQVLYWIGSNILPNGSCYVVEMNCE